MQRFLIELLLASVFLVGICDDVQRLEIRMPAYEVEEEDTYLCTAIELPSMPMKLVAVEPHSDQDTVHHMLIFGCQTPASDDPVWPCKGHRPCKDRDSVIYGWGRNAEKVEYPEGVAFSVGTGTNMRFLILQVHYLDKRPQNDNSGVNIHLSEQPSEKTASVLEYASSFAIPPGKNTYSVPNACCYSGFEPLKTVAFRVHTHEMGRKVYMTKAASFIAEESVVADRDPLLPQGFVPVKESVTIFPGERTKATCDFDSSEKDKVVVAGNTHNDEMCNLYMMVYSEIPHFGACLDGEGFYFDQKTGIMQTDGLFQLESTLSNLWKGPNAKIGQGVGVDRGHDGRIWFLHRGDRTMDMMIQNGIFYVKDHKLVTTDPVLVLNPTTGAIESSWGAGFFSVPHMLTIAMDGSVWITDVGKHQVFKFSPDGELLLTLGEAFAPLTGVAQFCAPTQVAVLTDGSVLVSDGYCNKRIVKFNASGDFVTELKDPELALPHSLLADECSDELYVADRDNGKVVVYQLSNLQNRLGEIDFGRDTQVMALARGPYHTFLFLTWDRADKVEIFQLVNEEWGASVIASWTVESLLFPHDLTLSAAPVELTGAGDRLFALYIADVNGKTLAKFILCPPNFNATHQIHQRITETQTGEIEVGQINEEVEVLTASVRRESTFRPNAQPSPGMPHFRLLILFCSVTALAAALYFLKRKQRSQFK